MTIGIRSSLAASYCNGSASKGSTLIRVVCRAALPGLSLMLGACTFPPLYVNNDSSEEIEEQTLGTGDSVSVRFFTNYSNFATGVDLEAGNRYRVDVVTLSNWVDGDIARNAAGEEIDERGFANELMAFDFLGQARRSREHQWFELMLYQPRCADASLRGVTDLTFDPETRSYEYAAVCDGELHMFVNDSYGFYSNNTGFAGIALSRD